MEGFFTSSQASSAKPIGLLPKCGACKLNLGCNSPKMPYSGKGKMKILIVGEAPGCVSGDTLIDTAYRDKSKYPDGVPIKELVGKTDFYVYSFDVDNQSLAIGKVKRVWSTGVKEVYRVTYEWRDWDHVIKSNSIVVTKNHPFLLKRKIKHDAFAGIYEDADYLSIENGLRAGHSLQPFYRRTYNYSFIGVSYKIVKESRFLLSHKLGRSLVAYTKGAGAEECHHKDENKLNDSWENLGLLTTARHAQHHFLKNNPMRNEFSKQKHNEVLQSDEYRQNMSSIMKDVLSDPVVYAQRLKQIEDSNPQRSQTLKDKYADPVFYYRYLLGRQKCGMTSERMLALFRKKFPDVSYPPEANHKVVKIEYLGEQEVFDMEVEQYHNFAANGIFVHNSNEDEQGRQFVGSAGEVLRKSLRKFGVDFEEDCWAINAVNCRPPKNRTPSNQEIDYCRPLVMKAINELKPEMIIPLGLPAVKSVIGPYINQSQITASLWVGWEIPFQKWNTWICPNYHPSYVHRAEEQRDGPVIKLLFESYLERSLTHAGGRPFLTVPDYAKQIRLILDPNEAAAILDGYVQKGGTIAIDYETNRLKPDAAKAAIFSCAVCWQGKDTIAYPFTGAAVAATSRLIQSDLRKIGTNNKFEDRWSRRILGVPVRNWIWDTMLSAHHLDNRKGICGVEFQAFVRLGQLPWDEHIHAYLRTADAEGYNRIHELAKTRLRELLIYNGIDSLVEYKIAQLQRKEMKDGN